MYEYIYMCVCVCVCVCFVFLFFLTNIFLKEQTKYIQNQINKIRDSVEDRQSRIV